jgi:hypothetical protein
VSVLEILEEHTALGAAYNSRDRELEHASACQEGTREKVLGEILAWSRATTTYPVFWLVGHAGSGKSTIAHTIAKQCDDDHRLAFSFFFSSGKQDRGNTAKFVPTFAYQLAQAFDVVQPVMRRTLIDHPSTLHLRLCDQIEKLITRPALAIPRSIQPMVVVIDGLDESSDKNLLCDLIGLLVDTTKHIPFRFLFTSRPERHIQQTFESLSTRRKAYFLSLRDFLARSDVRSYLQLHLSKIRDQNDHLMRDVPDPWPSPQTLDVLVHQSDGLFIYVSTLVKFVAGMSHMTELPQERLQAAMTTNRGVDPLYHQVLSTAQKPEYFHQVIGTIVFLRHPLTISKLGQLLQLPFSYIRLALDGCQSILVVPDSGHWGTVHPYHASLRDFLTDHNRAGAYFFDPQVYHVSILVACLELIRMNGDYDGGSHLFYACKNWCYHFSSALLHHATMSSINASSNVVTLIEEMEQQWLKIWMYGLEDCSGVEAACADFESVVARMMVSILCNLWSIC